MAVEVTKIAEDTLQRMTDAGFDAVHVSVGVSEQDELNIAMNEPSLLRSTEDYAVSITGLLDGRKASAALTDISEHAIAGEVASLFERVQQAPQDDANAVSSGQVSDFSQGPMESDLDMIALKTEEILDFRSRETPLMNVEEGGATHALSRSCTMTSEGTRLTSQIGVYALSIMGTASDGENASSFNYTGGNTNDPATANACSFFGIEDVLRETVQQITTQPIGDKFVGDIILAPSAVSDLLGWLLGQLSDGALIADSSIYRDRVGEQIANEMLTIRSNFEAPGRSPFSGDGFVAPALTVVDSGKLTTLLPGLYGSRKTGIAHVPTGSGWQIDPGETPLAELVGSISRGAMVNRLSMGSPGPNGDFSGVIKNSFLIENGHLGAALAESMIAGNMGQMLNDVSGISAEHMDYGGADFPYLRIPNLNFS